MSRYDVEDLVRDAFQGHGSEMDASQRGLVDAVWTRVRRRRRQARTVALGATATAVLTAAGLVPVLTRDHPPGPAQVAERRAAEDRAATADWRWESALGAEIRVPDSWGVNDYGCLMTDKPSVVRAGGGSRFACLTPEAATKEVAFLSTRAEHHQLPVALPGRPVTVDGEPAVRTEGRLPDGRWAGSVAVDSRQVALTVRTLDRDTTRRILDSFRLVEIDHAGCATRRPTLGPVSETERAPAARGSFVSAAPTSIGICRYPQWEHTVPGEDRLLGGVRLTGVEATGLAAALNAARPGGNVTHRGVSCVRPDPGQYDALLLVTGPDGKVTRVRLRSSGCAEIGLDDGARRVQLTITLLNQIMRPLHDGYGVSTDVDIPR
ncbi:hypothetical protein [Micromonospora auratinigra]|uniref:Uncharacterized protein n=1 Tax=Micromonospora auratinigra TaxID=261654 RepID=A0A1A8ZTF1_9ACTN|nr:hypothetical protein [Micromonospora auratinigra]SBT47109.1 hypothetical protein GA0070611_3612 [Micromonospora auratinigra]